MQKRKSRCLKVFPLHSKDIEIYIQTVVYTQTHTPHTYNVFSLKLKSNFNKIIKEQFILFIYFIVLIIILQCIPLKSVQAVLVYIKIIANLFSGECHGNVSLSEQNIFTKEDCLTTCQNHPTCRWLFLSFFLSFSLSLSLSLSFFLCSNYIIFLLAGSGKHQFRNVLGWEGFF